MDSLLTNEKISKAGLDRENGDIPIGLVMVEYRGKTSENFARALHRVKAPCRVVMTLRKLKTVLPSLKLKVDPMLKRSVVYHITCPQCNFSYAGETDRHLITHFREHKSPHPIKTHLQECQTDLTENNCRILHQTSKGVAFLETLEALYIKEIKPELNIKDEWRNYKLLH